MPGAGRRPVPPAVLAAAGVAVLDSVLCATRAPWARRVRLLTKPALVPAITLAVRSTGGRPSPMLGAALAGSWGGDVALLSETDAGFLGGVGSFAAAHAAYLTEIRRHARAAPAGPAPSTGVRVVESAATAGFAAVFGVAGTLLWRRLDAPDERRLRVPVLGYAALVTGMGAAAVRAGLRTGGPAGRALAAGGGTFVVSDMLVALAHFGPRRIRAVELTEMLSYAAAQALLASALAARVEASLDDRPGRSAARGPAALTRAVAP